MLSSLKNEDKLNELVPTRPCCPQCQTVLSNKTVSGNETALHKIPNDLRNAKNTSDAKKKYNEDEDAGEEQIVLNAINAIDEYFDIILEKDDIQGRMYLMLMDCSKVMSFNSDYDEELLTAKMMLLWNGNIQKSHL